MADIDGTWNCTVKSPLGDQKLTMALTGDGSSFSGQASGAMGSLPVSGTVSGDKLAWKMSISVPMPMTLDCAATISGDTLTGDVGAGGFGSFALTGTRG
ncbi:hypothetical protein [uncultured Sphingomonas sp.]|uniref:hypothetical protein n=1 Tax=uncultured Sphingomonas sp. TaxID=158754 RepID=UPI0035CB7825